MSYKQMQDSQTNESNPITLPTGGGSIKGISEKFATNPVTGTSSFGIPLPTANARGFAPKLSLNYDSGSGNGIFGLGWSVNIPSIGRKTEKGLPKYLDVNDSDIYTLSGVEDLVPLLELTGDTWQERVNQINFLGVDWEVKLYRPRIEGSFSKIERWFDRNTSRIWWRTVSTENVTSVFGLHEQSCLCEADKLEKIFKWQIDFSYDDKGHFTNYVYERENGANVDYGKTYESHRNSGSNTQIYLKKVLHGLKESRLKQFSDIELLYAHEFNDRDFHFQTVFDYGEHSDNSAEYDLVNWDDRLDPFSNYQAGFEIRTYRRCSRVLLFHDFIELGDKPELIKSVLFEYEDLESGFSFLNSITGSGYKRDNKGVLIEKNLPPLTFTYQEHLWNAELKKIDADSIENLPIEQDFQNYQWVDLYSEGLSGLLTEQAGELCYSRNLGSGKFAKHSIVSPSPSLKGLGNTWNVRDLESDGRKSLVSNNGIVKGYFDLDGDEEWQEFFPFEKIPNINFSDPSLRIIDLNGDGKPDILIAEETAFLWYPSLGKKGFDESKVARISAEVKKQEVIFSNESESIFTADMTGDGLSDIVRIRNGEIVYWANKGYGQFGAKITMGNAPQFDYSDSFSPQNIRLADINGSGASDVIYLGKNEFQFWFNRSGNDFSSSKSVINPFPDIDNLSDVSILDLLGTGMACVVWMTSKPHNSSDKIRYIDLMGSVKPNLMKSYNNGMGKIIDLEYTPSTKFYLEDKERGEPWKTKLHFPVQCLSKTETFDKVNGSRFSSEFSYHHGYYDHIEKEFRGFGRIDTIDTEDFDHFVKAGGTNIVEKVLHQTPVLTKTWYHNGAFLNHKKIISQYETEYYQHPNTDLFKFTEPELPENLTTSEWREALRACKGIPLRSEVYGLDRTELEEHPFSIAFSTCKIKQIQPPAKNQFGVFQTLNSESINISLDRNPEDVRVTHNLLLDSNEYGQPILSAVVNYGRRLDGLPDVQAKQKITQCVVSKAEYTLDEFGLLEGHNFNEVSATMRSPVGWKSTSYELGVDWNWTQEKFAVGQLLDNFENSTEIEYSQTQTVDGEKRMLSQSESRFANDTLDGERTSGHLSPLGIGWKSYQLAFTPDLLQLVYGDKIDSDSFEGGYVDLNNDRNWWTFSGTPIFEGDVSPDQRFYIPYGSLDQFGAKSWVEFDEYLLLAKSSSVSKSGLDELINETISINDYRTLSPKFVRDANLNWAGVETDELGITIKSAVMGKIENTDENTPPADDTETEGDNLDNPSAIFDYGFYTEQIDEQTGELTINPAWTHSLTFCEHYSDLGEEERQNILQKYEYADGSGNIAMIKVQAESGLAKQLLPDGSVIEVDTRNSEPPNIRWIGNGRTIINNKGNPVKQYEPYFSVTHEFESSPEIVETGITPILFYDTAGRNICKLNPNKTYEKVVFDSWMQQSWDVNDNLYIKPQNPSDSPITDYSEDLDVGHFFAELEPDEYSPSWYATRINGDLGLEQQNAAIKTEPHTATPGEIHTDALGRPIYALAHNGFDEDGNPIKFVTQTELDIEGNTLSVIDDRDNAVMSYLYNMLPPPDEENPKLALYQNSMDGGEKWTFFDIQGKAIKSWDSREHIFENEFDSLQRPIRSWATEEATRKLIGLNEYVDSDHQEAEDYVSLNLIGSAIKSFDQTGKSETSAIDFKGNLLEAKRTLANEYKTTVDWKNDPESKLETEVFRSSSRYDALNRITYAESPHHESIPASITEPSYNDSGSLDKMHVSIRGGARQIYVEDIDYDAKGQRQFIKYGNGVTTNYFYESDTYRLKNLLTTKTDGTKLQDLQYFYDPVGNISEIRDNARQTVFFNNSEVEPHCEYWYDPLYQLTKATGREHSVQANMPNPNGGWEPVSLPNSDSAMIRYTQTYEYDGVGNISKMAHRRPSAGNSGWTRNYLYENDNNRLKETTLGDVNMPFDERYTYNAHGSITSMNHLPNMDWNYAEQFRHASLGGGGDAYYVYDAGGQRSRKIIETEGSLIKERIYFGVWEIYRERDASGLKLERETLHIMDDQSRIALAETKTFDRSETIQEFEPLIRYQMGNHLGSASLEIDNNGEVISYEEFHPYGTTAFHAGKSIIESNPKRYRYTGKERDTETGFSYHGARYLSCLLARWISTDPGGLIDGANLYVYTKSNPIVFSDPSGLSAEDEQDPKVFSRVSSSPVIAQLSYEHRQALNEESSDLKENGRLVTWTERGTVVVVTREQGELIYYANGTLIEQNSLHTYYQRGAKASDDSMTAVERLHIGLDVLGLAPGLGEAADLTNAAIYYYEGDYVNAGISTASAAGGDALKIGKYGSTAASFALVWAKNVGVKAARFIPDGAKITNKALDGLQASGIKNMATRGIDDAFDPNLLEAVKKLRIDSGDISGNAFRKNYGAVKVRIGGRGGEIQYYAASNLPGESVLHSEKNLLGIVQKLNEQDSIEILQVFSERIPCHNCENALINTGRLAMEKVYYAVPELDIVRNRAQKLMDAYGRSQ